MPLSFILRILKSLALKHPRAVISLSVLLSLFSIFLGQRMIRFDTNQDSLMNPQARYAQNYQKYLEDFGDNEYFYIVIDRHQASVEQTQNFIEQLAQNLKKYPEFFSEVSEKLPSHILLNHALLSLDQSSFQILIKQISDNLPLLSRFLHINNEAEYYDFLSQALESMKKKSQPDSLDKKGESYLRSLFLAPFSENHLDYLKLWPISHNRVFDPEGYLLSPNGQLYFIRVMPVKNYSQLDIVAEPLKKLREIIHNLKPDQFKLKVGVTGKPVLQNDEAEVTGADSVWAGLGSLILVALLIYWYFRSFRQSLLALFALCVGMSLTLGFIAIVYGKINLITIVFTLILIGFGIDYGVHFLIAYHEKKQAGASTTISIEEAYKLAGRPILLGALTTAVAFLTALLTDFRGLSELGVIASFGVIACALSELTILPAGLLLFDREKLKKTSKTLTHLRFLLRYPRLIIGVSSILAVLSIPYALRVHFNFNLLELQADGIESVIYEHKIQNESGFSTWFLIDTARDLESLSQIKKKYESLSSVARTESILDLYPLEVDKNLPSLQNLTKNLATTPQAVEKDLQKSLLHLHRLLNSLANEALSAGFSEETEFLLDLSDELKKNSLNSKPLSPFIPWLKSTQSQILLMLNPKIIPWSQWPQEMQRLFIGSKSQNFSLLIYPQKNIWEWNHLEEFLTQTRSINPDITGAPVTTYESAQTMVEGFTISGLATILLITILIYFDFRNWRLTFVALAQLSLSFLFLIGSMGLFGINLNLANFFALPLLIGTGIDQGLHVLHRYKLYKKVDAIFDGVMPGVILSAVTTLFGFGTLSFVRHRGLASYGWIMTWGTIWIILVVVAFLPAVLKMRQSQKNKV